MAHLPTRQTRRIRPVLALAAAAVLTLSSCSSDDPEPDRDDDAGPIVIGEPSDDADTSAPEDSAEPDPSTDDGAAADGGELRDGTWAVGQAGEVEFRVTGPDGLELVEVRENQGWQVTDTDVEADQIEVDLDRGPVGYTFQVEIEGGVLEIEIDQDVEPAEPGRFDVGQAGTVQVAVEGGRLVLQSVDLADGWTETSREEDGEEVEIGVRRDGNGFFETWEFAADLDDGQLEVAIDYEVEGTFPG